MSAGNRNLFILRHGGGKATFVWLQHLTEEHRPFLLMCDVSPWCQLSAWCNWLCEVYASEKLIENVCACVCVSLRKREVTGKQICRGEGRAGDGNAEWQKCFACPSTMSGWQEERAQAWGQALTHACTRTQTANAEVCKTAFTDLLVKSVILHL